MRYRELPPPADLASRVKCAWVFEAASPAEAPERIVPDGRLERDGERPWTDAALAAGYYDQSHFIREFHRFVGCRPGEFFRPRPSLAQALVVPTEP